ncbi:NADP-dependent malic enzyme [Streptomyces flavidovirens]|uniref:NAD(P)-dependent malic enzyme n=1 Tax=Streptomyces flavidovirens TaxID=67298 RepID=UPI003424B212
MTTPPASTPTYHDDAVFAAHRGGKMEIAATVALHDAHDLATVYTPGVARVCTAIAQNPDLAHDYTWASKAVAVLTDGSAVLGLGDIGPRASLPVMEGKALLYKKFAGIDAVPLALDCADVDDIVETIVRLAPSFGGVNLEDIAAPRCFEIERKLTERLDIPVFHDDQHGTAIVTLAALRNAARLTGRPLGELRTVISGAGAAGIAIADMLRGAGVGDLVLADRKGVLHTGRTDLTPSKRRIAQHTNTAGLTGSLEDALAGADVFIGVSGGTVSERAVAPMGKGCFIFAMANPTPEIHPDTARKYAAVVATGRSDFPHQINNVLAFPGIFAGALHAWARKITPRMKAAAAEALADVVADELRYDQIIPSPFDERVAPSIAEAVAAAARAEGVTGEQARSC